MSTLDIEIENGRSAFKPGEEIRGKVKWEFPEPTQTLELSLFWRTQGKGTQDVGVTSTITFDNPGGFDQRDFRLKAPDGPYSFSGKLISIIWALELVEPAKAKHYVRREIVISPTQEEIVCSESPSDSDIGLPTWSWRKYFKPRN